MFCSNCGTKIPKGSKFCPKCGHKVGVAPTAQKSAPQKQTVANNKAVKTTRPKKKKGKLIALLCLAVVVIGAAFFAYRMVYYPKVVKAEVIKNGFVSQYRVDANVFSKKVIITPTKAEVSSLVFVTTQNDYSTHQIGAEERLAKLEKELPGNWTVQIVQNSYSNRHIYFGNILRVKKLCVIKIQMNSKAPKELT